MIGRRILYVLALAICLIVYGLHQQWLSWILLLIVLLFPWLSLILSLPSIFRMRAAPSASARLSIGSEENIGLRIISTGPHPPVRSRIRLTVPFTGKSLILKPGDRLPAEHCCGLIAELHKPRTYDFLGLFRFRTRKTDAQTFLVLPDPVRPGVLPDLSPYLSRSWHPKHGGGFSENHEIRQYHPGDSLNQIHWKMSAKAGELMLREPMEPEEGRMLLTMELNGSPDAIDRKIGRFLWLSKWLLNQQIPYDFCVLTGNGIETWTIWEESNLDPCLMKLLCAPCAPEGSVFDGANPAAWQYHIGGEPDEV